MRTLILMRGAPACGKSTFIKEHNLQDYTLCTDNLRLMYKAPQLNVQGNFEISQEDNKIVWNTLFQMLEHRMKNGDFTVIDATTSTTKEMNKYLVLAKEYKYRTFLVDMTNIPMETCISNDSKRDILRCVGREVIEKFYERFKTEIIPNGIEIIKPNELDKVWNKHIDLTSYKKIHVIGDVHGCYDVLNKYIKENGNLNKNECYIFVGDYIDRGDKNAETLKYLFEIQQLSNVYLIEGNHESWLCEWSNNRAAASKQFETVTKNELELNNINKKETRKFYRGLYQALFIKYHEKEFLISHGGVSRCDDNKVYTLISTKQLIKGVGRYSEIDEVDKNFHINTTSKISQIHGHRNTNNTQIITHQNTYNLEGAVEQGGNLRCLQIFKDKANSVKTHAIEYKNTISKVTDVNSNVKDIVNTNKNLDEIAICDFVNCARNNLLIKEKQFDNISSFNFTRKAFYKKEWNDLTIKARGLYIDTKINAVCARGYEKFFNIGEREDTQIEILADKLKYPVNIYVKENGFLGIVGWDYSKQDLLITTKSAIDGDYAKWFKEILFNKLSIDAIRFMTEYIKNNKVSFVFECIDIERDPHIIGYSTSNVVLLDIIKNKLDFEKLSFKELQSISKNTGIQIKKKKLTCETKEDFLNWYNSFLFHYNDNLHIEHIEGFVIEDSNYYMIKLKTYYYNMWKKLRGAVAKANKYQCNLNGYNEKEKEFIIWYLKNQQNLKGKDIIELRDLHSDYLLEESWKESIWEDRYDDNY